MRKIISSVSRKSWIYITIIFIGLPMCIVWYYVFRTIDVLMLNETNNVDWLYIYNLSLSLIIWSVYFRIVKYFSKIYTSKAEDRFFGNWHSFCFLLVGALLSCLIAAVVIFYYFEDSAHKMEFSIVSCFISIPYLTYKFTQHYIRTKKKKGGLSY